MLKFGRDTLLLKVAAFVAMWLQVPTVFAYAIDTHTTITEKASLRSKLNAGVLSDLGLGNLETKVNGRTVIGWLKRGADFEDSTFPIWESSGSWARYRHHFYNPLNGQGYSYNGNTGYPSPSWGLEDQGDYDEQKFSLKDGYGFLLQALTLPTKAERDEKFARLFETLGHTVHLLQDAAQPQHTRNDSHALGSLYETYTNSLADKEGDKGLPFGAYPVPSFPTARDFFHTESPGAGNVLVGKGMAEYSNRGFITTHTNFEGTPDVIAPSADFPTPNGNNAWITTVSIRDQEFAQHVSPGLDGDITFIGTNVPDTYDPNGTFFNARTSTYSVFQPDLEAYIGGSPGDPFPPAVQKAQFTFNTINAREQQKFLIPRAVSYSAGLINWFFRGKIDMVKDPNNANQYLIKNLGTEPLQGTFTLYYDDVNDVRKLIPNGQWSTAAYAPTGALLASDAMEVPGATVPSDAKNSDLVIIVFSGVAGAENLELMSAKVVDLSPGDWTIAVVVNKTISSSGTPQWKQCDYDFTINQSITTTFTVTAQRDQEIREFVFSTTGHVNEHQWAYWSPPWHCYTESWRFDYANYGAWLQDQESFKVLVTNGYLERIVLDPVGGPYEVSHTDTTALDVIDLGIRSSLEAAGILAPATQ